MCEIIRRLELTCVVRALPLRNFDVQPFAGTQSVLDERLAQGSGDAIVQMQILESLVHLTTFDGVQEADQLEEECVLLISRKNVPRSWQDAERLLRL